MKDIKGFKKSLLIHYWNQLCFFQFCMTFIHTFESTSSNRSGYNSYFKVCYRWLGKKVEKSSLLPSKVSQISSIYKTALNDPENFMDTQDIYLRVQTKNMLKKFLDQSDISQDQYKKFRDAARYYFESAF